MKTNYTFLCTLIIQSGGVHRGMFCWRDLWTGNTSGSRRRRKHQIDLGKSCSLSSAQEFFLPTKITKRTWKDLNWLLEEKNHLTLKEQQLLLHQIIKRREMSSDFDCPAEASTCSKVTTRMKWTGGLNNCSLQSMNLTDHLDLLGHKHCQLELLSRVLKKEPLRRRPRLCCLDKIHFIS